MIWYKFGTKGVCFYMQWAKAPEVRDQIVLFAQRLDDVVPIDHSVRLMDDILSRLDWSKWQAACLQRPMSSLALTKINI